MVKANGYGHGIVKVANALESVEAFGVACIEEALELRTANIKNRIVLMEGFFEERELKDIYSLNLEIVLHHREHLAIIRKFRYPLRVWIKINTGMNRLGFNVPEVEQVYRSLLYNRLLTVEGFITHFAKSTKVQDPLNCLQIKAFHKAIQNLPGSKSLANSAAIIANAASHGDWIRPGILLYGISPFKEKYDLLPGLHRVMSLQSALIAVKDLRRGDIVGYGGEYICQKRMKVGIVAVGYGDGYPYSATINTPVLVNRRLSHLVGRVSMDMIAVNLSDQPKAKVGDPVELWGSNLPVESVADSAGTVACDLLAGLSSRVPFQWIE